jgi:hypothetical protein
MSEYFGIVAENAEDAYYHPQTTENNITTFDPSIHTTNKVNPSPVEEKLLLAIKWMIAILAAEIGGWGLMILWIFYRKCYQKISENKVKVK